MSIYQALVKAQEAFPDIPKPNKANVGQYSYRYADLPGILKLVRPVLAKHGLGVYDHLTDDRLFVHLYHESGEKLTSSIRVPEGIRNPQDLGKWLTYHRRYLLCGLLGIAADEDTDAVGVEHPPPRNPKRPNSVAQSEPEGGEVVDNGEIVVKPVGKMDKRQLSVFIASAIKGARSYEEIKQIWAKHQTSIQSFPEDWRTRLRDLSADREQELELEPA